MLADSSTYSRVDLELQSNKGTTAGGAFGASASDSHLEWKVKHVFIAAQGIRLDM